MIYCSKVCKIVRVLVHHLKYNGSMPGQPWSLQCWSVRDDDLSPVNVDYCNVCFCSNWSIHSKQQTDCVLWWSMWTVVSCLCTCPRLECSLKTGLGSMGLRSSLLWATCMNTTSSTGILRYGYSSSIWFAVFLYQGTTNSMTAHLSSLW